MCMHIYTYIYKHSIDVIFPELIYKFNANSIKIPVCLFLLNQQADSNIYMELKGAQNSQKYCEEKVIVLGTKTS